MAVIRDSFIEQKIIRIYPIIIRFSTCHPSFFWVWWFGMDSLSPPLPSTSCLGEKIDRTWAETCAAHLFVYIHLLRYKLLEQSNHFSAAAAAAACLCVYADKLFLWGRRDELWNWAETFYSLITSAFSFVSLSLLSAACFHPRHIHTYARAPVLNTRRQTALLERKNLCCGCVGKFRLPGPAERVHSDVSATYSIYSLSSFKDQSEFVSAHCAWLIVHNFDTHPHILYTCATDFHN